MEAGPPKSRVGFISFIIFVLKTTSLYFDLIYYYYYYLLLLLLYFVLFSVYYNPAAGSLPKISGKRKGYFSGVLLIF